MPFPMKIQPIDTPVPEDWTRLELVKPLAVKSRLKRLLERQFSSVLRNSAADKTAAGGGSGGEELNSCFKDGLNYSDDFEPSSACLAKMVRSFIEENPEKHSSVSVRCGQNGCNCFNRICDDSSGEESDSCESKCSPSEASEILKGLASCTSVSERNLLADTAKILEKNHKICKRKDGFCRKIVTDELINLGYDASICKSRWEKSSYYPAGEYEYTDVVIEKERFIIDVDFRSEFEIARSTKAYKAILQNLPNIFVGKCDRLQRIVAVVSEAAKQSLKKKGMHVPPWRTAEYVRAKWLSPYTRIGSNEEDKEKHDEILKEAKEGNSNSEDLIFGLCENSGEENTEEVNVLGVQLKNPPEMKPKGSLSGLTAVFDDDNP